VAPVRLARISERGIMSCIRLLPMRSQAITAFRIFEHLSMIFSENQFPLSRIVL
jgi:hypothetical protein